VWLQELDEMGERSPWSEAPAGFTDAAPYRSPSFEDYLALLDGGMMPAEKVRYWSCPVSVDG
jgi:hypothetical protein